MVFRVEGSVIDAILVLLNALLPISVTLLLMTTVARLMHWLKAPRSMKVTLSGIVMDVSPLHPCSIVALIFVN